MKGKGGISKQTVLLAVGIAVAIAAICLAMASILHSFQQQEEVDQPVIEMQTGSQVRPEETQNKEALEIDVADYTVYDLDELNFRFVIARFRIRSNEEVNVSLDHFITDEGKNLSDVSDYVDQLEQKALFLGKQNVGFELVSKETSFLANLFIPVISSQADTITVKTDFSEDSWTFNLSNAQGKAEDLAYLPEDVITDGKTYQMRVSEAFELTGDTITRTFDDGTVREYQPSSTAEIHAFKVEAVSLWGDEIVIESAKFTVDQTHESFEAFNEQFTTMKYTNLINHPITDSDSGVCFFETLNPEQSPILYQGTLELRIKGQTNPILIRVAL